MLSGLLITLNILVCISLIGVVLLQRSEGGAFGMGGGPTGLITTRGAGDLLTRTTWVLFGLFLALSMGLTLLGAHDRTSSSVIDQLKNQTANPSALIQKAPPPAAPAPSAPAPTAQGAPLLPPAVAPAPVQTAPTSAPLPKAMNLGPAKPAHAPSARAAKPAAAPAATPTITAPAPAETAPAQAAPTETAPPPAPPVKLNLTPPEPKADPNAPVTTGSP